MIELLAILLLAGIALYALWRRPIPGHGQVVVRLYEGKKLRVERLSKCQTSMCGDTAVVTSAYVGLITEDMRIDRITVALADFPDKEVDTHLPEPVWLFAGSHLTVERAPGNAGILTLT